MDISVLGISIKNVCSVVGLDASGAVVMRRRIESIGLAEKLPACIVGMRGVLRLPSPRPCLCQPRPRRRLMSPEYVRPYIKAQKNDRDAEGMSEAATRPTMRFVELKSQDQLDMQKRLIDRETGWSVSEDGC